MKVDFSIVYCHYENIYEFYMLYELCKCYISPQDDWCQLSIKSSGSGIFDGEVFYRLRLFKVPNDRQMGCKNFRQFIMANEDKEI